MSQLPHALQTTQTLQGTLSFPKPVPLEKLSLKQIYLRDKDRHMLKQHRLVKHMHVKPRRLKELPITKSVHEQRQDARLPVLEISRPPELCLCKMQKTWSQHIGSPWSSCHLTLTASTRLVHLHYMEPNSCADTPIRSLDLAQKHTPRVASAGPPILARTLDLFYFLIVTVS